jgi:transposase
VNPQTGHFGFLPLRTHFCEPLESLAKAENACPYCLERKMPQMKSHLLKAERIKRGWTQATVAAAVGVHEKTVGRWERGVTVPYPYFCEQLCFLFDKTPELLGLTLPHLWRIGEEKLDRIDQEDSMSKLQPTDTEEFKQEAVRFFETSGKSKAQIARDLGISNSSLNKWRKESENLAEEASSGKDRQTTIEEASSGKDRQTTIEEENRNLRRKVYIMTREREILKKSYGNLSTAFFVKYQFIHENRHLFPIRRMYHVFEFS